MKQIISRKCIRSQLIGHIFFYQTGKEPLPGGQHPVVFHYRGLKVLSLIVFFRSLV